ncbi:hypothetical protein V8C40DRAFT_255861 [Trichoderma camerunense]
MASSVSPSMCFGVSLCWHLRREATSTRQLTKWGDFFSLFFFFFSSCCPFGLPFSHGVCQCWQFMIDATTAGPTVRVAFWANV